MSSLALERQLSEELSPAKVRCALTAVLRKIIASDIFTEDGWLKIGVAGEQPGLGENYINTGSLYMCLTMFLPLGLSPTDPFWTDPDEMWSSLQLWSGKDGKADKAL